MFTDRLYTGQRYIRCPELVGRACRDPVEGAELGIYHYNARFYSPKLGRFLSADSILSGMANPQSLNRFSYVANNPVRYTDPTGHMICAFCDGGGNFPDAGDIGGSGYQPPVTDPKTDPESDEPDPVIIDATVQIGFGYDENWEQCIADGNCSFGLGTVVGDSYTIYTAWHVFLDSPYLYYGLGNNEFDYISMNGVTYDHIDGTDMLVIYLPVALPEEFVPANMWTNDITAGDNVSVAYKDETGFHVLETQIRTDGTYKEAITVYNPMDYNSLDPVLPTVLNHGDSGGGVFYNGYFVGVSSGVNKDESGWYMAFEQP